MTMAAIRTRERRSALTYLLTSMGSSGGSSKAWSRETGARIWRSSITGSAPLWTWADERRGGKGPQHLEVARLGDDELAQAERRTRAVEQ